MKKKLNHITIVFFCVLFLLSGCTNDPNKIRTIKVAQFGDVFIYTPLYIADIKGFFAEEGLKVDFINTGGDELTYDAVMSGSAVFGIADPAFVAIAQEHKREGRVVGGIVNGVPFCAITKKNISKITDAAMLRSYSVATFSSPSTAYTVQKKMFEDAGLKPNIKQGNLGGLIALLDAGQADIALELEPNVSTALSQGAKEVYSFIDIYPEFAFTGITTSLKTVQNEPELVQHFVNAITKAEQYVHQYPDSAAFYMCKFYPDIKEKNIIYDAINRMVNSGVLPENAIISDTAWALAIEIRQKVGDLKSTTNSNVVLDMSFAKNALK